MFPASEGFDLRDIADILVRQLIVPQRAPAAGKTYIAAQNGSGNPPCSHNACHSASITGLGDE